MELNTALEKYRKLQNKLSAYGHAMALIYYDGATTAPNATAANRGQTLSVLSEESYLLSTGKDTLELLEYLDEHKDELDCVQARSVYLSLKDIREMQKIPMEEYVAYQEILVEADDVWHRAKKEDDFDLFLPCLEKIFDFNKRFARYCAPEKLPYNYCLNKYEEGLTMEKCDEFFAALKSKLVPLIKNIGQKPQIDDSCLYGEFSDADQEKFSLALMDIIGIDKGHCGLGTTEHPFTISLGSHHDVRITTNYKRDNFASSMFSVIHEGGHALYDMGSDDSLAYTNLDGGVSMGIHESQSRFYENLLGRSREFTEYIFPTVCSCFPSLSKYTAKDFYRAINKVEPSLIRVEADEVTYALHVMVRYELEKRIMSDELEVKDLPAEWNRLYKEYLGVDVPSNREGVLQDSHWSGGNVGYFPSYALGSAYGAQLLKKMKETVDVETCLKNGNFAPINAWNKENIWKHGLTYTPSQLLDRVLGKEFDPFVFTDYLEKKYGEIYGL
ncbi:MAG: carboxypeptidase M32 [Oscillospiraceae bacterium]|nr:carboxypeptidase M32 [Oscillospiraceae bacterium]